MAIIGIIAIAKNLAIGKDGKLPWHYSADLKFFKQTTLNNCVVMGYNTWESIGKPLPNRLNIILSRSKSLENQSNVMVLRSKEEVSALANYLKSDLYVIGGAKTYTDFADIIDKWIVTEVPITVEDADVFMPKDFLDDFEIVETKELDDVLKVKVYTKTAKTSLE
ncbi:MAG: dihydrofolate reductase [Pyrinomonadaceae bacterium]|jgi:dihydrofolate reductase|nr:dihydrofolate reductase [Pyrinomonadaceae bacterium]